MHDIQDIESDDEDSEPQLEFVPEPLTSGLLFRNGSLNSSTRNSNVSSAASSSSSNASDERPPAPNIQIDPPSGDEAGNNEMEDELPPVREPPREPGSLRQAQYLNLINTEDILDLWSGNIAFFQRTQRTPSDRPYRINSGKF